MRFFLASYLSLISIFIYAQNTPEPILVFNGYIFSQDSIPVENAYLINYRDTKIVTTDSTGRFKIFVQAGDSLMINHISLSPMVIHAKKGKAKNNIFYVDFRDYTLRTVVTRSFDRDYYNFEKNIKKLYRDLEKLGLRNPNQVRRSSANPYNPDGFNPGVTLNLGEIIRLVKKKKHSRKNK